MTSFILQRALKEILVAQQNCAKCRLLIAAIKSVEDGGLPDDTVVTVDAVENLPLRITYSRSDANTTKKKKTTTTLIRINRIN